MCITFRSNVIPIVFMILLILLLPCSSIEISTTYELFNENSTILTLGTYVYGTILFKVSPVKSTTFVPPFVYFIQMEHLIVWRIFVTLHLIVTKLHIH